MNHKPSYKELEKKLDTCQSELGLLKESSARYQSILDEVEDGILEIDLNETPLYFNKAFCTILGYAPEELHLVDILAHTDKETIKTFRKVYKEVTSTGIPLMGFVHEITRNDGSRRIIENSVSLKRDADGNPCGTRSVLRDITDRKRAEQELAEQRSRLKAIFESVKDAIVTVDYEMRVIEANKATESVCGVSAREIIGKEFFDCFKHCDKSCYKALKTLLIKDESINELKVECKHDCMPQQVVDVTISPLLSPKGKTQGAVLVIRDITRIRNLERELIERHQFYQIIGKSRNMQDIYRLVEELSDYETSVLVTGETGTGKEMIAKALHYSGIRKDKPFIKVNCSALAESLLESELFGHVKGAFTGAVSHKIGRFQAAHQGTILLDEIGDISPLIQLKLLRVLQEKEFERVGESNPVKVDVRVIACTHQNLKEKVRLNEFRQDLYYRLKVIEINIPALRDRIEDIPLLIDHFCDKYNKRFNKAISGVSSEVINSFMNYSWPGNVRELEHTLERAFILCRENTILLRHIPDDIKEHEKLKEKTIKTDNKLARKKLNKSPQEILDVLVKAGWNKAKAARILGVNRCTIYRKIAKHNLSKPGKH